MIDEHGYCPACGQTIVLTPSGLLARHNMPGWTKGSKERADRGEIVRPDKCLGSLTKPKGPDNSRLPLTHDLDRCAWHPDRPSVGWRDVQGEDGARGTVGVCEECRGRRAGAQGRCPVNPSEWATKQAREVTGNQPGHAEIAVRIALALDAAHEAGRTAVSTLDLDGPLPCSDCGGAFTWTEWPEEGEPSMWSGRCACGVEWNDRPAIPTWRNCGDANIRALVAEIERRRP